MTSHDPGMTIPGIPYTQAVKMHAMWDSLLAGEDPAGFDLVWSGGPDDEPVPVHLATEVAESFAPPPPPKVLGRGRQSFPIACRPPFRVLVVGEYAAVYKEKSTWKST